MNKIEILKRLELQTSRLLLRPFREEDGIDMYALNDDPAVLQYTGDTQFDNVNAVCAFLAAYDQYEKYAVGRMTTVLKDTGEVLGWCGLKFHPESNEYDIGYRFFKRYWGYGYATESAMAVLEDGFYRLNLRRVVGRVRVENLASINVLRKIGLGYECSFMEDGEQWSLYAIER